MRNSLLLLLFALSPLTAAGKDKAAPRRVPDTLEVILSSEMENRSKVIRLKDPRVADTLLQFRAPSDRRRFDSLIADDAVAEEIRTQEEFRAYWKKAESESGVEALRAQYAARDVDKGRIPKLYLFDSSVVVYPGWIIVRKRKAGKAVGR